MRPLKQIKANYFYDDWDETVRSIETAQRVRDMPTREARVDRARDRWASLLEQGALFKRNQWINWRVPPDPSPLHLGLVKELRELGQLVDQFLIRLDQDLGTNALIRETLGFPSCPEEDSLWRYHLGDLLSFFRLDLIYEPDKSIRLLEIQIVMGGLGITQALRRTYGHHPELPGTAAPYEEAVLRAFRMWCAQQGIVSPTQPLIAVVGAKDSKYRHDHLVLARHLQKLEMVIMPLKSLELDAQGRPTLPDGRTPDIIHRVFRSPSLFENNRKKALSLMACIQNSQAFVVNPWKDVLEDKRILALIHHSGIKTEAQRWVSTSAFNRLLRLVPRTWFADSKNIAELIGRPRSQRALYLKKGRSFESRHLWDGQQVNLRRWDTACQKARYEGDWIIQEAVYGAAEPFEYLDFLAQKIKTMNGFVRLSPFYFRNGADGVTLGDVLITAREGRSRIHGASDAALVVPGQSRKE